MQLRYAADDVRYLPALRDAIGKRLEQTGHAEQARQACDELCRAEQYRFDPDTSVHRVRGSSSLSGSGLAILRELVIWRDATAREEDVPPRALLKDEILIDLASSPVKVVEKLARVRGLPRPIESDRGHEIVAATLKALATPAGSAPHGRSYEPTPTERFRADALWAAAQSICTGRSIDPNLVTSRQEIGELARALAAGRGVDDLRVMGGWRRGVLGQALVDLVEKSGQIKLSWNGGAGGELRTSV
jgi:ribonuclease D